MGQAHQLLHNDTLSYSERWDREVRLFAGQGYGVTLETRGTGGNRYFYTAQRVGGRVVKKYLGKSLFAATMAGCIMGRNIEAKQERQKADATRGRSDAVFQSLDALGRRCSAIAAASLGEIGYHRHKRGPWRKRRQVCEKGLLPMGFELAPHPEHSDIVNAALHDPNSPHCDRAIEILNAPNCSVGTNLAEDIEGFLLGFTDDSALSQAFYRNQYRSVWREMTGTTHGSNAAAKIPAFERVLIDRVIVCRFTMVHFQSAARRATSYRSAEHAERDIDRAQRRLLSAVKCLAEVKRLGVPQVNVAMPGAVQVNVGEKQINGVMAPA